MDKIILHVKKHGINKRQDLIAIREIINRKRFMNDQYVKKDGSHNWSPLTATLKIPSKYLLNL